MEHTFGSTVVRIVHGDITAQDTDAIVNAANSTLLGGGGVDGAIHRGGGPAILEACKEIVAEIGELETSGAVITTAGNLPAKHVIHTVGPIYQDGYHGENVGLEQAYSNSLALALEHGLKSIAFPSISTGAYKFPVHDAALIAFNTFVRFTHAHPGELDEIRMVLFGDADFKEFESRFDEVIRTMIGT